jgi:NAD(P)-dependent dehydrogenase (short-subunit alcohol dehydrogenase family)
LWSSDPGLSAKRSRGGFPISSAGKHVLLAGLRQENTEAAAEVLSNAGFEVSTATVDVSSRESVHALVQTATALGEVTGVIHAAGSPPARRRRKQSFRSICMARR